MAGAAFGHLGASLFVAGTVFGEIWVDSRSAKCCHFQYRHKYLVRLEGDACCSAHCK